MKVQHEYQDLAGARRHADAEGHPRPSANKHDALAAAPLVIMANTVIKALQNARVD